jgi:hypothetical protein
VLTVEPSTDPFIRIRACGRLSAKEYDRFELEFAAELKRRKVPRPLLLLDIALRHLRFRGFGRHAG